MNGKPIVNPPQAGAMTPLGPVTETAREFQIILFKDKYGTPCSLQQSSLAEFEPPGSSAVWLGVDRQDGPHDGMFDAANQTRMHLDLKQAKALNAVLEQWIASGSFVDGPFPPPGGRTEKESRQ